MGRVGSVAKYVAVSTFGSYITGCSVETSCRINQRRVLLRDVK